MPTQTALPFTFNEGTSAEITWDFQDEDGVNVANAVLQTATLTLYDVNTDGVINSRNDQDILGGGKTGANDVVITAGQAVWYVQPADNVMVGSGLERHIALVEWSWDPGDGNGVRQNKTEITIDVQDLNKVP